MYNTSITFGINIWNIDSFIENIKVYIYIKYKNIQSNYYNIQL